MIKNIDNCVNHQCVNGGVCVDGVNTYSCTCPMGFSGEFCQNDINDCSDDICGPEAAVLMPEQTAINVFAVMVTPVVVSTALAL